MGIADADTAENEVPAATHLITPLTCSVAPGAGHPKLFGADSVEIKPGTLLAKLYGRERADEQFFCNYGVNPDFEAQLLGSGAIINARGPAGEMRGFELPQHYFFLATLFQPQLTSAATDQPHPVITGYLRAVAARAGRSAGAT